MAITLFKRFRQHGGRKLAWSIVLLLAVAALEAAGLLSLMPLIEHLGIGRGASTGWIGASWMTLVRTFGVEPTFETILVGIAGVLLLQSVIKRASDRLLAQIEAGFAVRLREELYDALVHARWLTVNRLRSADISRTLTLEVDQATAAAQQALSLAGLVAIALIQGIMALVCSVPLALLAGAIGILVALAMRPLHRRTHELGKGGQEIRRELNAAIAEHLAGFKVAKSHGREGHHLDLFRATAEKLAVQTVRIRILAGSSRSFFEISAWLALLVFLFAAVRWAHVATGELVLIVFIFTRLLPRIGAIQASWQQFLGFLPAFASVEALRTQLLGSREELPGANHRFELQQAVTLNGVSFRYDADASHLAVKQVSFSLPARRMTALVGPSGSGKSTLADLILGLISAESGQVLIDGVRLDGARLSEWRNSIGYVPQEPFLFHDSIRANLLWAKPDATEKELKTVLQTAAAESFVSRLPHGLDTVVGDRGVRLSGGERQRLTLARALLRKPTLLLLDEATSSLDTENERFVQDAMDRLHGELTLVVIAHRLSTVQQADQVIVLNQGEVVEFGMPSELATREGGAYRRMMQSDAI